MVFRAILDAYADPKRRPLMLKFAAAVSTGMLALGFAIIAYILVRG